MTPARAVHPGQVLHRELLARGWTQKLLARAIDRPEQCVSEVVTGRKRITPRLALQLADVFGTTAEFWWHLQAAYELDRARETWFGTPDAGAVEGGDHDAL